MELCSRQCKGFDGSKSLFGSGGGSGGGASTTANLNDTFSNQLAQHSQVGQPAQQGGFKRPMSSPVHGMGDKSESIFTSDMLSPTMSIIISSDSEDDAKVQHA
ncbi:hypothetical protein P4O66_019469, partial [Electrophorus voltai]